MSSFKDLTRKGIVSGSHTFETDIELLRNEDFVFFSIEAGDRPASTSFGATIITLDFQDIVRLGGWISLSDQLFPAPGDAVHNGQVIRRGAYTDFVELR